MVKKSLIPTSAKIIIGFAATVSLVFGSTKIHAEELPAECQSNYKPGAQLYNEEGVIKPPWELPGAVLAEGWYLLMGDIKTCD